MYYYIYFIFKKNIKNNNLINYFRILKYLK